MENGNIRPTKNGTSNKSGEGVATILRGLEVQPRGPDGPKPWDDRSDWEQLEDTPSTGREIVKVFVAETMVKAAGGRVTEATQRRVGDRAKMELV